MAHERLSLVVQHLRELVTAPGDDAHSDRELLRLFSQQHDEHAFARLLELVDLTISDPRWKNHRLKELTRLREVICDELYNEVPEFLHPCDLRQYFLYFGILARSERDRALDAVSK